MGVVDGEDEQPHAPAAHSCGPEQQHDEGGEGDRHSEEGDEGNDDLIRYKNKKEKIFVSPG